MAHQHRHKNWRDRTAPWPERDQPGDGQEGVT